MDEASVRIAGPPERVWALVTDITRMGEWSPEATGGHWATGRGPRAAGAVRRDNRHGLVPLEHALPGDRVRRPSRFTFASARTGWRGAGASSPTVTAPA